MSIATSTPSKLPEGFEMQPNTEVLSIDEVDLAGADHPHFVITLREKVTDEARRRAHEIADQFERVIPNLPKKDQEEARAKLAQAREENDTIDEVFPVLAHCKPGGTVTVDISISAEEAAESAARFKRDAEAVAKAEQQFGGQQPQGFIEA